DILAKQNKVNEAIEMWRSIEKVFVPKAYLRANFKIGAALITRDDVKAAIEYWKKIDENDHPTLYPTVQLLIGELLIKKRKMREAIEALNKINVEDNPEKHAEAQLTIGKILIKISTRRFRKDISDAKNAFSKATKYFPYETYCYIQICGFLLNENT